MEEIWKDIKGYEGLYQVSNLGRVKSLNYHRTGREEILLPNQDKYGYLYVNLYKERKRTTKKFHRLVAETFIPNPLKLPQVNHINEDKTDNRVENLEWCSAKYNNNYGTKNTRMINNRMGYGKPIPILQYDLNNNFIKEYPSIMQVKKQLGYSAGNICQCCKGKIKQAYGFIWKYKEKAA